MHQPFQGSLSLVDDVEFICVVRECRELDTYFGTNFTDTVLFDGNAVCLWPIKKTIRRIDEEKLVLSATRNIQLLLVSPVVVEDGQSFATLFWIWVLDTPQAYKICLD